MAASCANTGISPNGAFPALFIPHVRDYLKPPATRVETHSPAAQGSGGQGKTPHHREHMETTQPRQLPYVLSVLCNRIRETWVSTVLKLGVNPAVPCAGGESD